LFSVVFWNRAGRAKSPPFLRSPHTFSYYIFLAAEPTMPSNNKASDKLPVEKKLLVVADSVLSAGSGQITSTDGAEDGVVNGGNAQVLSAIFAQNKQLLQSMAQLQQSVTAMEAKICIRMEQMHQQVQHNHRVTTVNIRRIAQNHPVRKTLAGKAAAAAAPNPAQQTQHGNPPALDATLAPHPRSLHDLWQEWTTGIGGRKAAQLFTAQERGRSKHKYTRRKHVWDIVAAHVRAGVNADVAIDNMYAAYGRGLSVTSIIALLGKAKRTGTLHPDLVL
jgi:hypothetical protein